jgi:hypothetical protein
VEHNDKPCVYPEISLTSLYIRGSFAKFVGNLWGFRDCLFFEVPPLASDALLKRSTHFSKTCCRPFAASFRRILELAVLTSALPFHGWKSPEIAWVEVWNVWDSNGAPPISVSAYIATCQSHNADAPLRLLLHPKKISFKMTVTPFSRSGWSVVRSSSLAKEILQRRDRHHTSTKFRL